MIIGIFGLYSQFLPLYELHIRPWRFIFSKKPQPGKLSQKEDMKLMQNLLTPWDQSLLGKLNGYIVTGLTLEIPNPYRIFYINTN